MHIRRHVKLKYSILSPTSNSSVPAASSLGLLYDGGQSVSEVGKQLVLQPHRQPQEAVEEARECGRILL